MQVRAADGQEPHIALMSLRNVEQKIKTQRPRRLWALLLQAVVSGESSEWNLCVTMGWSSISQQKVAAFLFRKVTTRHSNSSIGSVMKILLFDSFTGLCQVLDVTWLKSSERWVSPRPRTRSNYQGIKCPGVTNRILGLFLPVQGGRCGSSLGINPS